MRVACQAEVELHIAKDCHLHARPAHRGQLCFSNLTVKLAQKLPISGCNRLKRKTQRCSRCLLHLKAPSGESWCTNHRPKDSLKPYKSRGKLHPVTCEDLLKTLRIPVPVKVEVGNSFTRYSTGGTGPKDLWTGDDRPGLDWPPRRWTVAIRHSVHARSHNSAEMTGAPSSFLENARQYVQFLLLPHPQHLAQK